MLMIQARKNGLTERVPTTPNGELILDQGSSVLPPEGELVGGIEKPKTQVERSAAPAPSAQTARRSLSKKYDCKFCHRAFSQPTHLEVHVRSHIGHKPFMCKYCGRHFTQGGNLRTHQKLHTGDKPYSCDVCFKKFSRKGNLAAHMLTHQNIKPFVCKLDNCNKGFTQLGNMKAHQNRFHMQTVLNLTNRLAKYDTDIDAVPPEERELLDYFATLYKNSNKGIKGRGKGSTKIIPNAELFTSPMSVTMEAARSSNDSTAATTATSTRVPNVNYTTAPDVGGASARNDAKQLRASRANAHTGNTPKPPQSYLVPDGLVGNLIPAMSGMPSGMPPGNDNDNDNDPMAAAMSGQLVNPYNYALPGAANDMGNGGPSRNLDNTASVVKREGGNNDNIPNTISASSVMADPNQKFDIGGRPN